MRPHYEYDEDEALVQDGRNARTVWKEGRKHLLNDEQEDGLCGRWQKAALKSPLHALFTCWCVAFLCVFLINVLLALSSA